jgi:sulfide:quinone oxidoreductase
MSAPDFIKKSPLAHPQSGWVDVDKNTLQHGALLFFFFLFCFESTNACSHRYFVVRYPNVFSLGDASSVPTSRTAAAAAAESGVVQRNVIMYLAKKGDAKFSASYDGYCSCPLITSKNSVVLAEFSGFDMKPMESA